jgi:hypothetical protein
VGFKPHSSREIGRDPEPPSVDRAHNFLGGSMSLEHRINAIIELQKEILMSTAALESAIAQLNTDTASLIALAEASVPQASVDAATAQVTALDTTVQAALAALAPPAAPAA